MNIKFILFSVIAAIIFGVIIYFDKCSSIKEKLFPDQEQVVTIQRDTIYPEPTIVQLPPKKIPRPQPRYYDRASNTIVADETKGAKINTYTDSIIDTNVNFYYTSFIDGKLLKNDFSYKLKVPLTITNTITKTTIKPNTGFYATTSLGYGQHRLDTSFLPSNFNIGIMYINKNQNVFQYRYDIPRKTHHIGAGIRIFK